MENDSRYIVQSGDGGLSPIANLCHRMCFKICYYMSWKEVADTLEVGKLTHRLWTDTRRLIHEFSLTTGICNHGFT
jgi:hypothetical protein